ncbi:unnamed protein product [Calypogeia fissa]
MFAGVRVDVDDHRKAQELLCCGACAAFALFGASWFRSTGGVVVAAIEYVRSVDHTHRRWRATEARAWRTAKLPPVRAPSIFLPLPLASTVPPSLASLRWSSPSVQTYDGGGFAVSCAAVPVLVVYHSATIVVLLLEWMDCGVEAGRGVEGVFVGGGVS